MAGFRRIGTTRIIPCYRSVPAASLLNPQSLTIDEQMPDRIDHVIQTYRFVWNKSPNTTP